MRDNRIDVGSDEYKSMFTPDGRLNFQARKGLSKDNDPLNRVGYKPDARDERVEFAQQREFREARLTMQNINLDDDGELNEDW